MVRYRYIMENKKTAKEFYVQLPDVVAKTHYSTSTRLLAANLMENPYLTVGMYLTKLSQAELDHLCELSEVDDTDPKLQELIVITLMLLQAEGTIVTSEDDVIDHLSTLKLMIAGVSLGRKGYIKVNYENLSFNDDVGDLIVFEKLSQGEEDV